MARGARLGVILQRVQPTPPTPPQPEPFVPTPVVTYGDFDFPPNPDYEALFAEIAVETNVSRRSALRQQTFVVNAPLTEEEQVLFDYLEPGYIEPGPISNQRTRTRYVGFEPTD